MRLILCDRQGNMLRDVAPILSCKRHENLDGTDALTFSTTVEVVKSQRVIMQDGMGRWHEYVVGTVTEGHDDDGSPISQVWAESAMAHDFRLSYIQDRRPTRLADALSAIAEATRWRVGTCDVAASDQLVMMYHVNAWEALGEVVKAHGGEVQARISPGGEHPEGDQWVRYLDFLAHRGRACIRGRLARRFRNNRFFRVLFRSERRLSRQNIRGQESRQKKMFLFHVKSPRYFSFSFRLLL